MPTPFLSGRSYTYPFFSQQGGQVALCFIQPDFDYIAYTPC
jgi:hypothetical protein